jgi:hypothetical protein
MPPLTQPQPDHHPLLLVPAQMPFVWKGLWQQSHVRLPNSPSPKPAELIRISGFLACLSSALDCKLLKGKTISVCFTYVCPAFSPVPYSWCNLTEIC